MIMMKSDREEQKKFFSKKDILFFVGLFLCIYLFRSFFCPAIVDGASMEPTLYDGQYLLTITNTKGIKRFDIAIMKAKEQDNLIIVKRVIGLPGEEVEIRNDGSIYINGELLKEDYGKEVIQTGFTKVTVPEGSYFVMGDNRNNSLDSRFKEIGCIPIEDIIGIVIGK